MPDEDDDFGADADFLSALEAQETLLRPKVIQPTPQRLDKPPPPRPNSASTLGGPKIVQPTPQALPTRSSGSSILVSPRQKGNPILQNLKSLPWEYSDIPSDYVLGNTTCALFLSLKYHRLHPDYIYGRIRALGHKFNLRIVLCMVDIPAHEDALRELSKTSLINNVTIILCWSAAEAARYLELYKSYEHANFSAIKERKGTSFAERLEEFCTVPRSVNKSDAVAIVSAFGSVRNAVNARMEEIVVVGGWGEKKVRSWEAAVTEGFRNRKAKRRRDETVGEGDAVPLKRVPLRESSSLGLGLSREASSVGANLTLTREQTISDVDSAAGQERNKDKDKNKETETVEPFQLWGEPDDDDEAAMAEAAAEEEARIAKEKKALQVKKDNELSDGVAAALAKLRQQ